MSAEVAMDKRENINERKIVEMMRLRLALAQMRLTVWLEKKTTSSTYSQRTLKTKLPVRSALFKQRTDGLVVR
jgi:hypothetical protein